jgi:NitT/TauT family transport system ATP-binding protein
MRLKCTALGVEFRSQNSLIRALHNVNFETKQGEFLTVVGPSGCGKTTLLRALAGLIQPQYGTVERFPASGDTVRQALLVFQENSLFPWMTVLENAVFGLEAQKVGKAEREARAKELLQRFGFAGREKAYPHQLSLGMKQRVAVIRCFLSDPAVLLMDEPFAALDAQTRLTLQQELLTLWEQNHKSVVFVTHDVEEAILLSDRILVLSPQPGTVIAEFVVPFPRPREAAVTLEEDFLVLKRKIVRKLGMKVERVFHAGTVHDS